MRPLSIEILPAPCPRGRVVVRLGSTHVSTCITAQLVEPDPFRPKTGFLEINTRRVQQGEAIGGGQRVEVDQAISRRVSQVFKDSGALDLASLCVIPNEYVWSVAINSMILNDAGNAADATCWCVLAALKHFRRPDITIINDEIMMHSEYDRDPVPLVVHHTPVHISLAIVPASADASANLKGPSSVALVVDPSRAETSAAAALLSLAVNAESQIGTVIKNGGGFTPDFAVIKKALDISKSLVRPVLDALDQAVSADDAERKKATLAQFQWAQKRTGISRQIAEPTKHTDDKM